MFARTVPGFVTGGREVSRKLTVFLLLVATATPFAAAQANDVDERTRILWAERVIAGRDCQACDLRGADFSYQDLEGRDLSGANLREANLSVASLDMSRLSGAELSGAVMVGAKLGLANLSGADLSGATLKGAWLGAAALSDAELTGADISGAWLANVKGLTQTQLSAACGDSSTRLPEGLTVPACRD